MKTLFAILILVAFALGGTAQSINNRSCWDGTVAETYDGGDGTQENPYQIATAEQLALLAQQTNDGTGGNAYYILTNDICLNASNDLQWIPIGDQGSFTGVFDGNGHTISDMYVSDRSAGGLFARTSYATIKNTAVNNSTIRDVNEAGFIIGWAVCTSIINCSVDGLISYNDNASCGIGGIAGHLEVDSYSNADTVFIRNCVNNATIQANGMEGSSSSLYHVGGIVGSMYVDMFTNWYSYIVGCCNNGNLMGIGDVGGIVGDYSGDNSFVYNCDNYGQISSLSTSGGIVAYADGGMTINCRNHTTGAVTGNCTGGIVGYSMFGRILNCVNNAPVIGYFKQKISNKAGGIVGYIDGSGNISYILNCYNTGDITFILEDNMERSFYVGGIGGMVVYCKNCYNIGTVASSDHPYAHCGIIGGYVGNNTKNLYWLDDSDLPVCGSGSDPEESSAFRPGTTPTSWVLDEPQYGTTDLVEALNLGSNNECTWIEDFDLTNNGFPLIINYVQHYPLEGSEWYYEILNDDGSITYQHLEYAADTTIGTERPKIIVRSNTHYDRDTISEVTHEYVYEENGVVYWWNKTLSKFTVLYDFGAEVGDEWTIEVENETITTRVYETEIQYIDGIPYKRLTIADPNDNFSGSLLSSIGHQTSFFPERLMTRGKGYRVEGLRCYWLDDELIYKLGDEDCDAIYDEWHHGIDEITENDFMVYPNPANSVLFVETQSIASLPNPTYRITNLIGQTLLQGSINAETQRIDISMLPAGMYFITVEKTTQRFVVRR